MSTWKPASAVFMGGTQQIKSLVGARVRTRTHLLSCPLFDPIQNTPGTTDIPVGAVGFVANPHGESLLIAFPSHPGTLPRSLTELQRGGRFKVVVVNEPTFKQQFEVERVS
jgi:hypothetical protein